jgi:hypothetical protein
VALASATHSSIDTTEKTVRAAPPDLEECHNSASKTNVQTNTCERSDGGLQIRFILPS